MLILSSIYLKILHKIFTAEVYKVIFIAYDEVEMFVLIAH